MNNCTTRTRRPAPKLTRTLANKLQLLGLKTTQVARAFDMDVHTVQSLMCHMAGKQKRGVSLSQEVRNEIKRLHSSGKKSWEIAAKLKCSTWTVYKYRKA